jgi:excisionase family DNA binding protein
MAQKLITLEEAAQQLGIAKDRLLQLRTEGKVPGYRDGASWKFRSEVIDKLQAEGLPQLDSPPSDINLEQDDELRLADDDDLELAGSGVAASPEPPSPAASGVDLELADEEPADAPMASDVSLDDVDEPTVEGLDEGSSDALALDPDDTIDVYSDSILLSEAELGGPAGGRPPSTIIGKGELDLDADLDLSPAASGAGPASDVKLAQSSDIVPGGDDDLGLDLTSPTGDFAGLEELEVDLEAESSRILAPEDVAKVKSAAAAAAAAAQKAPAQESDLELAPSDSAPGVATSDVGLGGSMAGGTGLTGLSALELEDDDDQVLGEGSDVTLSGESSGINIISPSDSGLALDEVKLDLAGQSPIGSSLDLGGSAIEEVTVDQSGISSLGLGLGSQIGGGDFQLTPLGEAAEDEEERDSSQVIALDELSEDTGTPLGVGTGDSGMLVEDFGAGLTPGVAPVGVVSTVDTPFSVFNVVGLSVCILMLMLSGMMVYDLLRNIWSWEGETPLTSSLLESVLNPFL